MDQRAQVRLVVVATTNPLSLVQNKTKRIALRGKSLAKQVLPTQKEAAPSYLLLSEETTEEKAMQITEKSLYKMCPVNTKFHIKEDLTMMKRCNIYQLLLFIYNFVIYI